MVVGAVNGLPFGLVSGIRPPLLGRPDLPNGVTDAGLVEWFRPSDASTLTLDSSGRVARMRGVWNGIDCYQEDPARRPSYRTDFAAPYLGFDGAHYMLAPALASIVRSNQPYTLVFAFILANFADNYFAWSAVGNGGMFVGSIGPNYYNERTANAAGGGTNTNASFGLPYGGPFVGTAYYDGPGGNMVAIVPGVSAALSGGAIGGVDPNLSGCWLGGDPRDGGVRFFRGVIGEAFLFDQALQGAYLDNVQNYLRGIYHTV